MCIRDRERDVAAVGHLEQVQATQHGALAGAAGSDDADDLAPLELEVDALQNIQLAVALLEAFDFENRLFACLLYTSPSPRDRTRSRMPSSA